jgi:peptide/nickel transport system substrate-binding protein
MTDSDDWLTPSRRRILSALGAGSVTALAGCSGRQPAGDGGDGSDGNDGSADGGDGGSTDADGSDGGSDEPTTVRIGIAQGGWDLIPARDTDFVSNLVYTLVYDNVVNLNPAAEIVPELATEVSKESDTQYVFDLREGVTFHNGETFTAQDVKYTYDWIQNEENPRKNYVAQVEEVVVEDDTTVRFDLSEPFAPFLYKVHAVMWPLSQTAIEEAGEDYNQQPVGTGPFTFEEWDSGNRAVLSAYADYWNGEPAIDTVEFRILPEASSKVTQLETGDIDIVDTVPAPFAGRIQGSDGVELIQTGGVSSGRVDFNTDVDGLGERDVRRALTWAIDKQQIVDTVFTGFADPAKSVLPNSFPQYADDISDFNHPNGDTDRAQQLLQDAGYGDLTLEIKTSTRSEHRRAATLIQSMWSNIGVDASVKSLDGNTFFSQELEGDYEVAVSNWTWLGDPDTLLYLYHSEGLNVWNIADDELDSMLDEQRRVTGDQRQQLIRDIQQYVYEEAFSVYTYYPKRLQGISSRVSGFEQYPNGSFRSLGGASVD